MSPTNPIAPLPPLPHPTNNLPCPLAPPKPWPGPPPWRWWRRTGWPRACSRRCICPECTTGRPPRPRGCRAVFVHSRMFCMSELICKQQTPHAMFPCTYTHPTNNTMTYLVGNPRRFDCCGSKVRWMSDIARQRKSLLVSAHGRRTCAPDVRLVGRPLVVGVHAQENERARIVRACGVVDWRFIRGS